MRTTMLFLFGFLLLLPVKAEMSPGHAERRQAKSPEAITIKVVTVTLKKKAGLLKKTEHVTATAEVTAVTRSAKKLKVGDTIKIEYTRSFSRFPEAGASPAPVLKKGGEHPAFLRPAAKAGVFEPDVFSYSFKKLGP